MHTDSKPQTSVSLRQHVSSRSNRSLVGVDVEKVETECMKTKKKARKECGKRAASILHGLYKLNINTSTNNTVYFDPKPQ
ncbi:MAG: hypothetical protein OEZ01_15810, partial [Candidatus Heimdallarchaeota archaeon]|nr:hypothetical protein [Candidatus Heimdallarchaeota archaeon]